MSMGRDLWVRRIAATLVDLSLEFWGGALGSYFGAMVAALATAMKNGAPEQMQHSVRTGVGVGFAFWAIAVSLVNRVLIQGVSRSSIGKKVFKLELISSGDPLTWTTVMTRWLISIGSLAAGGAGYFYAFFNAEEKSFHDLIANTDVVPAFEGASLTVEYREDTRSFEEVRQMMVLTNVQSERPLTNVVPFPNQNGVEPSQESTGTDGKRLGSTLADVISIEKKETDVKKAS